MPNARTSPDGRSFGLVLAALAAIGWGAAFYALSDNVETRAALSEQIVELETENARLAALVDAKSRLDSVEVQIRAAREELVATLDRRRDLEENIAALHTDLVALDGSTVLAVTGSTPDGDETQARATSLNAALARLDRTIAERSRELTGIDRAREEAEARLGAATEAAAEMDRNLRDLADELDARSKDLAAAEQRLSGLLADNARLDRLNERRTAALEALATRETAAREKVAALRADIGSLEVSIATGKAIGAEIAAQEERLAGLREVADREDMRVDRARRELAELQAQVEAAQAQLRQPQNGAQSAPQARPSSVEDRPDGSRVIRVTPSLN